MKNTAVLQVGNFGSTILQGLIGVFMARLLQPERYGIYSLAFGLAGLISVFLGLGAQDAVTTIVSKTYARQDTTETHDALAFLLKVTIIVAVISLVGAVLAPYLGTVFYHNDKIGVYAAIIVTASVISTFFFSFSLMILQVVDKIKGMTILGFADQTLRSGLSLILVLFGFGVMGAVSGHLIGAIIIFIASVIIWEKVKKEFSIIPSIKDTFKHMRKVSIKKHLGFSTWITIDRNVSNLYNILPIVLTGIYVATAQVTFFKLAFSYVNLALTFMGPISILLNVEFPKMLASDSPEKLRRNFIKVSLYSLGLSTLLTVGAVVVSPIAFRILYGKTFNASIQYAFGLVAYGSLMGIGVGLGSMWRAINKVKVSMVINAIVLGIGIPLGLLLIKTWGLWGSVIMVTLWYTVSHFTSFFYLLSYTNKSQINA